MFRLLGSLRYSAQNYRIAPKQSNTWRDMPVVRVRQVIFCMLNATFTCSSGALVRFGCAHLKNIIVSMAQRRVLDRTLGVA